MNTFVSAVKKTPTVSRTENGMVAYKSTLSACVDLFGNAGSARGQDKTALFERAYQENREVALRIALWVRDARGGAGERKMFRDFMLHVEKHHQDDLLDTNFLALVPVVGRWDDLLVEWHTAAVRNKAFDLIGDALRADNGLCAKWMPRKGIMAAQLRNHLRMTPKSYRKTLVGLTNVVETAMCAQDFTKIEYAKVPSLAMSRYLTAFHKNDGDRFEAFKESLKKGEVKVNAGALFPYDVIKALRESHGSNAVVCDAQWAALPDYMDGTNVLPMVDVSGSMEQAATSKMSAMDIALSLGLYCADKNKGPFKEMFLTFSNHPTIEILQGTLSQKLAQMETAQWGMNTNLHAAFDLILGMAKQGPVTPEDMPKVLLILSDMQFDVCAIRYDDRAVDMAKRKYEAAGFDMPLVVFWNLAASKGNVPVTFNEKGVCLVSGFSPAIMKAILSGGDVSGITPESMMMEAVSVERYNFQR